MILVVIALYVFLSWAVALLGQRRKFGFWGYFFCSLLFSPALGCLFIAASDKLPVRSPKNGPFQ